MLDRELKIGQSNRFLIDSRVVPNHNENYNLNLLPNPQEKHQGPYCMLRVQTQKWAEQRSKQQARQMLPKQPKKTTFEHERYHKKAKRNVISQFKGKNLKGVPSSLDEREDMRIPLITFSKERKSQNTIVPSKSRRKRQKRASIPRKRNRSSL